MAILELDQLRRELEEIRRLQRPEPPLPPIDIERDQLRRELEEIRRLQQSESPPPPIDIEREREVANYLAREEGLFREVGLAQPSHPDYVSPLDAMREQERDYYEERTRTQWPKEQAKRGRLREAGLAQPSHPYYPYADEAWQQSPIERLKRMAGQAEADIRRSVEYAMEQERERQLERELPPPSASQYRPGEPWPVETSMRGISMRDVPPVAAEEEIQEEWPWSDFGREMLEKVPWRNLGEGYGGGYARMLPGGYLGPQGVGRTFPHGEVAIGALGETVGHEYGHAASSPWLWEAYGEGQEDFLVVQEDFKRDVNDWLFSRPTDDWSGDDYFIYRFLEEAPIIELYAALAGRPQMIPPELEHWFPQYDLTRRQAMGVSQRPDYRGPQLRQYPSSVPPPPYGVGSGK